MHRKTLKGKLGEYICWFEPYASWRMRPVIGRREYLWGLFPTVKIVHYMESFGRDRISVMHPQEVENVYKEGISAFERYWSSFME